MCSNGKENGYKHVNFFTAIAVQFIVLFVLLKISDTQINK